MSEPNQTRCLVLLPPASHSTRLFDEILSPALAAAGLAANLVQLPVQTSVPPAHLLHQIDQADALLALGDESALWFALGYATALGKPICLLSPAPDAVRALPQIATLPYPAIALPSDFLELQQNITQLFAQALPQHGHTPFSTQDEQEREAPIPPSEYAPPSEDSSAPGSLQDETLVSYEVLALTIIDAKGTASGISPRDLGLQMRNNESAHLTSHAMNALKRRGFIERRPVHLGEGAEHFISDNIFLTPLGERWLIRTGRRSVPLSELVRR